MLRSGLRASFLLLLLVAHAMAQGDPMPALRAGFERPPRDAKPMVLWPWLNGYVDRERALFELREMQEKGIGGALIWDIGSLADREKIIPAGPAFLGEESLETIRLVLAEAERLGLEMGMVASSSWNAGGDWIEPKHASKQLLWAERELKGPMKFEGSLPKPDGLTEPFTEVALLAVPKAGGEPVDLGTAIEDGGTARFDLPAGDWTLQRFVCCGTGQPLVCPSPNSNGLVVDHLIGEATDFHFDTIMSRLRMPDGRFPASMRWLMLDSFEVWPRVDWTHDLTTTFLVELGYDPTPWLPVLAGRSLGKPELEARFEHDYRELIGRLMTREHFARAASIVDGGLRLISEAGHGGYPRVDALEALGSADLPMGEFWNGKQFWVTKEAASAAHIYGRRDVAAEALTGWRHWRDGPAEYKRLMDLAFCAGLTRPVFHTFAHNPEIAGKPGFAYHAGEHFNVNSTWWEQSGPMLEYLARCSHMLRQGRFVADVAFYYGDDAPSLVPPPCIDPKVEPPHDPDECQHCGRKMPNRTDRLGPGYDFDYVNADIVVRDMKVVDGKVRLSSGMEYEALVLPEREDLDLEVLRKVEQLVEDGARVFGVRPSRATGLAGYPDCDLEVRQIAERLFSWTTSKVRSPAGLRTALFGRGVVPDVQVHLPAGHPIHWIHRRTADADIYFVSNTSDEELLVECSFRVSTDARPSLWDPMDGSITDCLTFRVEERGVRVPLRLDPIGSMFVVFERKPGPAPVTEVQKMGAKSSSLAIEGLELFSGANGGLLALLRGKLAVEVRLDQERWGYVSSPGFMRETELDSGWSVQFPADAGAPDSMDLESLTDLSKSEVPGVRFFSGTARYSRTWEEDYSMYPGLVRWELDLGKVAEVAEVTLNGQSIPMLWKPPYRVDVTEALRSGENTLEICVTNTWHNRIVGDLRNPDAEPVTRTNMKLRFRKDMELLPSGLIGPVRIRPLFELPVIR